MSKAGDFFHNPVTGEAAIVRIGTKESGGELLIADLYIAPRGAVMGEDYHPAIEERFTLIRGELGVRLSGRATKAKTGVMLLVPPGVSHDWWNAGDEDAVVRVEIRPAARFEIMILNAFGLAREFSDVVRFTGHYACCSECSLDWSAPFAWLGYRGGYPEYLTRRHEHHVIARRSTLSRPGRPLTPSLLETA